jgi:LuxR family maltose regulon positive regulatory protein
MKARIWVAQGRLTQALEWVREQGLSPDNDLCYLRESEHITLARILIAQYQNDRMDGSIHAVMRFLDRLLQAAEDGSRMGSVIENLVLQALAHQAQGSIPPALAPLERALTLAEPEGYVRIFLDEGEPMRLLILDFRLWIEKHKCDQDHKLIGYTDNLLAAFSQPIVGPQSTTNNTCTSTQVRCHKSEIKNQQSILVEPLSERELEVLRLVAQGLTNNEISQRLVLALSTVKGHNLRIFSKLQAQNRSDAVARARELGLL